MPLAIDLLGPLRVSLDGRDLDLTAGRLRVLLTLLALSPARPVTLETLATALWADEQPENPRRSIQTYVTRLRNALGGDRIDTEPSGYRLRITPSAVDALRFGQLVDAADSADHAERRRALLTEALGLWRGAPFEDLGSSWLSAVEAPALVERYLAAVVRKADLDLAEGRHEGLVADLRKLTRLHPLHETLWARLLVALARSGRPADALAAYEAVRSHLAEELGTDPGAELKTIYADLLSGAIPGNPPPPKPFHTPHQLPAAAAFFTGRRPEAADLAGIDSDVGPAVTVVNGMAGVGKTALALHVAHQVSSRFPDGQLFVDLHGHSAGQEAVEPARALDGMLRALGVEHGEIPPDLAEKSALFRTCVAGRRILLVLDDAAGEDQVVPLLPGTPESRVIVTSRRRLGSLSSAHRIDVPVLPAGDGLALLRRAVGRRRLAASPSRDLIRLVRMCGGLPLVLLDAAARLRTHPAWTPADLSARLDLEERRVAALEVEPTSGIATALDGSYRNLVERSRTAYRLLGLHPGADFDAAAAAALTGMSSTATTRVIEDLLDAHLMDEPHSGRYRFRELVRRHAAALGHASQADRAASIDRLLDHYGLTAAAATSVVSRRQGRDSQFPNNEVARRWLDAELSNLLATGHYAADNCRPDHLLLLSDLLARHLETRNRYADAQLLHSRALAVARELRDQPAQLTAMLGLGALFRRQDRATDAVDILTRALRLAREIGDRAGELAALTRLGHVERKLSRLESATGHYHAALALAELTQRPLDKLDALTGLGRTLLLRRRFRTALSTFARADRLGQSIGASSPGLNAVSGLGDAFRLLGDHRSAETHYRRAATSAESLGDRNWQMESAHGLGLLYRATGQPGRSVEYHQSALRIAGELSHHADQARAHDALAKASLGIGRSAPARRHWQRALDLLAGIDASTTEEGEVTAEAIRIHLTERL
ncbi:BTAD domain-containing putative transcriptional regulator [Asanoa sp. WMMD1127]|uniref:AfsR/SARP family transcriptional regulator n=1 Tax=Asanoa sp. WMMD1127 TaxID=3016107 RepID=UPI002417BF5D|nr:AfsR/SARP family transcriptional regulator [Asanoa sp. WMMD1127]MDG4825102.1 BTAD domain-containing putative transcriptional regulator [Asanoa sp. WMMD1127]